MRRPAPIKAELIQGRLDTAITSPTWTEWYQRGYDYYMQVGQWVDPYAASFGKLEPALASRRDGLIVYANGVDFDPGSGKGYYRYDGDTSAWVLMA